MPFFPATRDRAFWGSIVFAALVASAAAIAVVVLLSDSSDAVPATSERPSNGLDLTPAEPSATVDNTEIVDFDDSTRTFAQLVEGDTPTVVNFFASWCTPCLLEMPAFEAISLELAGEVRFVGLAMQDRPEDALRTVEDTGVTYEVARDRDGAVLAAVGGVSMPTTAFVDADGNIVEVHSGELSADELRALIDELFGS